jgi:predicted aspartyl protease
MQLWLKDSLPYVTIMVAYQGKMVEVSDVLVDTGSASTILSADKLMDVGIKPSVDDILHTIRGIGGGEVVFLREVDFLKLGERSISDFEIEVGGMDYGFDINGILGMDFLIKTGAIINLRELRIDFAE